MKFKGKPFEQKEEYGYVKASEEKKVNRSIGKAERIAWRVKTEETHSLHAYFWDPFEDVSPNASRVQNC